MRTADVTRNTKETQIRVKLNLDGSGKVTISDILSVVDQYGTSCTR